MGYTCQHYSQLPMTQKLLQKILSDLPHRVWVDYGFEILDGSGNIPARIQIGKAVKGLYVQLPIDENLSVNIMPEEVHFLTNTLRVSISQNEYHVGCGSI